MNDEKEKDQQIEEGNPEEFENIEAPEDGAGGQQSGTTVTITASGTPSAGSRTQSFISTWTQEPIPSPSTSSVTMEKRSGAGTPGDPYTWTESTGWSIQAIRIVSTLTILNATPPSSATAGTYRLTIEANAIASGIPSATASSPGVEFPDPPPPLTLTFQDPTYTASTRSINAVVTFSENPTSFTNFAFKVDKRSGDGTPGDPYTWAEQTRVGDWRITSTGSGVTRTIMARPRDSVDAGTYRIRLPANAFGSDQPATDTSSNGQNIIEIPSITFSRPGNYAYRGIANYNNNFYVLWVRNNTSSAIIRKYSSTGIYDNTADITVPIPDSPPSALSGQSFSGFGGMDIYNNNIYLSQNWSTHSSVAKYSITGTFQNTILTRNGLAGDISTDGTIIAVNNSIYNLSDGTYITFVSTGSSGTDFGVAITPSRIYVKGVIIGVGDFIRVFSRDYTRISSEDRDPNSFSSYFVIANDYLYTGIDINPYGTIYQYGSTISSYTATFGTPTYNSNIRTITSAITFSAHPGSVRPQSFRVDKRSGAGTQGDPYTWSEEITGWNFTVSGTDTTRTIIATPADSIGAGTYRIRLPANSFHLNGPSATATTAGIAVAILSAPVITASFAPITYTASTRAISVVTTFSAAPQRFMTSAFVVERRSGAGTSGDPYIWTEQATGWAITAGSGTTVRTITATPEDSVRSGTYRITLEAEALIINQPSVTVNSDGRLIDLRPLTASFAIPTYTSQTRAINSIVTFSVEPDTFTESEFKIDKRSGAGTQGSPYTWAEETTGWTISATGSGISRTITGTPTNSINAGTYRIRLPINGLGTNQPSATSSSDGIAISAYIAPITATFTASNYDSSSRSITIPVTFSGEPNNFNVGRFIAELRSGAGTQDDPYVWTADRLNWRITATGSGTSRTILAEANERTNGTYRIVLPRNGFDINQPTAAVMTSSFLVTALPSITFTEGITGTMKSITNYKNNYYILSESGRNQYKIGKYSSAGVYDNSADIIIPDSTNPPSNFSGLRFEEFDHISIYNNKIYLLTQWGLSNPPSRIFSVERYSITGTFEETLFTVGTNTIAINNSFGISINGNIAFISAQDSRDGSWVRVYNLSDGTLLRTIISNPAFNRPYAGINTTQLRIYLTERINNFGSSVIRVYDRNYNRIASEDIPIFRNNSLIVSGEYLYVGSNPIYQRARIPVPSITATWSPTIPNYSADTREISSTITFSQEPVLFLDSAFKVQIRSGDGTQGDPYTWADQSTGWTITSSGSGTTRTIIATPDNNVNVGTYRITLPANALATNQPSAAASTEGREIQLIVAVAEWSSVEVTGGKLQGTLTFEVPTGVNTSITGIANDDFDVIDDSDAVQTGWVFDTPSATATAGTGITIAATPPNHLNENFKLRLKVTSVRSDGSTIDNTPSINVDSTSTLVDTRQTLTITSFGLITGGIQTGEESTLSLVFPFPVPTTELDNTDFPTTGGTVKSVTGQTIVNGETDTYHIVITNPTTANGSYNISVRENGISNGDSYLQGPVATDPNRTVAVNYDTRPEVTVESFISPDGTQTGTSSTLRLTLEQEVLKSEITTADFLTTAGTIASVAAVDTTATTTDNEYDLVVTNPTDHRGSFTVNFIADAVPDGTSYLEGPDDAYTSEQVSYDTRSAITVTDFEAPSGTQSAGTARLILTLGEAVPTGQITSSDFDLATGTSIASITGQSIVSGQASVYHILVNNPDAGSGTYTIDFNANAIAETDTYKSGPVNAVTSETVTYDTRVGLTASFTDLTVTQEGQTSTLFLSLNRTVPATEVTVDDFSLSITTASIMSVNPTMGNASTYTIVVTNPTDHRGSYILTFAADSISAGTGYDEGPSTATTTTVTYDTRKAITGTLAAPSGIQRDTSTFVLTLGTAVPTGQITDADFTFPSNTSISSVDAQSVTTATTYHIVVNNPATSEGSYTISFNANSIVETDTYKTSPTANIVSGNASYNTIAYTATWSGEIFTESTNKISATISFSHDVDGLATTDFEILDTSDTVQSWAFDPIVASVDQDSSLIVSATVPANTNGTFRIRLKEDSVEYNNLGTDNGPEDNTDSFGIEIDNRPQLSINSFTAPSGTIETATATLRLTFNQNIPKTELEITDFSATSGTIASITAVDTTAATTDNEYDIVVTNPTDSSGSYTITLETNAVAESTTYKAGPLESDRRRTSETVNYDTREAIMVNSFSAPATAQPGATTTLTLILSESIPYSQIQLTDFRSTQTLSNLQPTVGNSNTFTLEASNPNNANGTYDVVFNANTIDESATYKSGPPANVTATVTYDRRAAVTVVSFPNGGTSSNPQTSGTTTLILTLSHEVLATEVTTADFSIVTGTGTAGTITSVGPVTNGATNDNEYNVVLTNPTTAMGDYRVAFRANAVPDGTSYKEGPATAENATIYYDTRPTVAVSSFTRPSGLQTGGTSTFRLTLNVSIPKTELDAADFETSDTRTGTITIASVNTDSAVMTDNEYDISVINPINSSGQYTVTLMANTIVTTSTYKVGPSADFRSQSVSFDTRTAIMVSSFNDLSGQTGTTSTLTLVLDKDVPRSQIDPTDFSSTRSISNISSATNPARTFTLDASNPPNRNGTYDVTFRAGSIDESTTYKSGPPADETATITYDTRSAVGVSSFTLVNAGTQTTTTTELELIFNQSVPSAQLTINDFDVTGTATISSVDSRSGAANDTIYDIVITNPTASQGTYNVSINPNAIPDSTSYKQGPIATDPNRRITITYDTRLAVTASWSMVPSGLQGVTSSFELTFNQDIPRTQITNSDFSFDPVGPTISSISPPSGNHRIYTILVNNPSGNGSYTITLSSGTIVESPTSTYKTGPSTDIESDSVSYDRRVDLTATLTGAGTMAARDGATTTLTLTFSQAVPISQVTDGDFDYPRARISIVITPADPNNSSVYTIVATNQSDIEDNYDITLRANSIESTNVYRQGPATAVTTTVYYDTRSIVTASWGTIPTNTQTSETVTLILTTVPSVLKSEITSADFSFSTTGPTINDIIGEGSADTTNIFNVIINQPTESNGTYNVTFAADAISDGTNYKEGPDTSVRTPTAITYDTRNPITASWTTVPTGIQTGATSTFVLTLSDDIPKTELETSDFSITTGTITSVTAVDTTSATEDNEYTVIITNPTGRSGRYTLTLNANTIEAGSDYLDGPVSTVDTTTIRYDTIDKTITATWSNVTGGGGSDGSTTARLSGRITFTSTIPGYSSIPNTTLSQDNFEVLDNSDMPADPEWNINTFAFQPIYLDGTSYSIIANPPGIIDGMFKLRLKSRSILVPDDNQYNIPDLPLTNVDSDARRVNRIRAAIIIPTKATVRWTNITGGAALNGRIYFDGADVTDIESTDFEVLNDSDAVQTGWDIRITTSAVSDGQFTVITAIPPSGTNGSFKLRIKTNSVKSDGSAVDNAPEANDNNTSSDATVNSALLDNRSKFTLRIDLPENRDGSLQISVKPDQFTIHGLPAQLGPRTQQYLGTIFYNNRPDDPRIINIDVPDQLQTGDNDIIIDFNLEVENVEARAFMLEGMTNVRITNSKIFYAATPDPDISPSSADRNTAIVVGTTKAKYYRVVAEVTGRVESGILNVYLKDGIINNDP